MKEVQSFARLKCFVIIFFLVLDLYFWFLKIAEKIFSYGENSKFKKKHIAYHFD